MMMMMFVVVVVVVVVVLMVLVTKRINNISEIKIEISEWSYNQYARWILYEASTGKTIDFSFLITI